MKKNLIFGLFATAMLLLTTACQKENDLVNGNEVMVNFEVSAPVIATRADYSDGTTATKLQYAVYNSSEVFLKDMFDGKGVDEKDFTLKTNVSMRLALGNEYYVLFWAEAPNAPYDVNFAEKKLTVNYPDDKTFSNDENRDAFYCWKKVTDEELRKASVKIEMRRPFAQLNIGTGDTEEAAASGVTAKTTAVKVKAYKEMNFSTSEVSGLQDVVFDYADVPTDEKFPVDGYDYLAMNYLLVRADKEVINEVVFQYTGAENNKIETRTFTSIPVRRNYRTNIYGNLLTQAVDFNVEIKPEYLGAENVEAWDGSTVTKPAYETTTQTYSVETGAELAWLAALVNGTLPADVRSEEFASADNLKGVTIKLEKDVELAGREWTPIGAGDHKFEGIFDGNGFAINNLVVTGYNSSVGLFGNTQNGEIKNLTIENAKVSGRLNVGVVAGNPYTSKYTNITVKGLVQVNGMAYVGAVGGKNAYANWTDITVAVEPGSYVKANSVENGTAYRTYVGGVVGFNGEGTHSFTNITSNINVEGSTCDVGGLFGIAHYGNKFENLTCTGNVTITNAEESEEAEEIGGIAGVWNNGGQDVEFTNCKFTGKVTTNIERNKVWYGNLIGKPYSKDGKGKLIIDGLEFTTEGVSFEVINEILATGNGFVFPFDLVGKAEASNAYGVTGLNQLKGGVLDGNNYTLNVTGANTTWASAINTTGGTIKNLTVAEGFRGIFVNHNSDHAEKVILNNVTIDGPVYTISCDQGTGQGLDAVSSTINGWTSYAATIGNVTFTNCNFGEGAGYAFCRPYAPTVFTNCDFAAGYKIDPRAKVTFDNCRLNGEPITAENYTSLVTSNQGNVAFPANVSNSADLAAALTSGAEKVYLSAGEYTMPAGSSFTKNTTLVCAEGTIFTGNSKLNINGATIIGATFSNPSGTAVDQTINGTFKGCKFEGANGARWCYAGETVVFEDCVFSGSTYGVHFDGGANDVIFRNCTISGFNALGGEIEMVTFEGCTFVGNGKSAYNGANLWGSAKMINCEFTFNGSTANEWIDCIGTDKTYEFTNCTINGVDYTNENYTDFDEIESRNHITVKINGVDCQM